MTSNGCNVLPWTVDVDDHLDLLRTRWSWSLASADRVKLVSQFNVEQERSATICEYSVFRGRCQLRTRNSMKWSPNLPRVRSTAPGILGWLFPRDSASGLIYGPIMPLPL